MYLFLIFYCECTNLLLHDFQNFSHFEDTKKYDFKNCGGLGILILFHILYFNNEIA